MNETVLAELRDLALQRGYEPPFESHVEFQKWADKVIPRLKFEPKLAAEFKNAVATVEMHKALGLNTLGATNEAIGLLNQGVQALESVVRAGPHTVQAPPSLPPAPPVPLELPTKLTLKWLYEHAPVSFYLWFVGILAAAFLGGIAATETPFYQSLRPRNAEPTRPSVVLPPEASTARAPASAAK